MQMIMSILNPKGYFEDLNETKYLTNYGPIYDFQVIIELFYYNNVFILLCFRKM